MAYLFFLQLGDGAQFCQQSGLGHASALGDKPGNGRGDPWIEGPDLIVAFAALTLFLVFGSLSHRVSANTLTRLTRIGYRVQAPRFLRTAASMLSLYDTEAQDMSTEANHRKAVRLTSKTASIVTTFDRLRNGKPMVEGDARLGFAANFLYTLVGKKPDDVMERAFDVARILLADHELNASTFAARVTAATLSDIYSSVTSGIGALKGPLHGGANQEVIRGC